MPRMPAKANALMTAAVTALLLLTSCAQSPPAVTAQGDPGTGSTDATRPAATAPGTSARTRGTTAGTTPGTTRRAPGTSTTSGPATGDEKIALAALITDADLPAGEWETSKKPKVERKASGYDDLGSVPACTAIAGDDQTVFTSQLTEASVRWEREPDDELDISDTVEIYDDQRAADSARRLLQSPDLMSCLRTAMSTQLPGATADLRTIDPGVTAEGIGADYVVGFDVTLGSATDEGRHDARVVVIGKGRGTSTIDVSVSGDAAAKYDPRSVETANTLRAAARNLDAALR